MKKLVIAVLLLVTTLSAFYSVQQARRRAIEEARRAEAERAAAETAAESARQQARSDREQARLRELNSQLADPVPPTAQRQRDLASGAARPPTAPGPGEEKNRFQEVHKDPEMKEAMRRQAKQAVEHTVKQMMTADLIQQLGLDEAKAAALKDLLTRKGTLGFEFMMPLMSGEFADDTALAESGRQLKSAYVELDQQLKSLLGDDGYAALAWQEKSQPDRDRLGRFVSLLKDAGEPLGAPERDTLLAAMYEERRQFHFTIDYGDTTQIDFEHFHDFYGEDKMNTYFNEIEELNRRLIERGQSILTPEQSGRFADLLRDQLLKGKYVVKTTHALVGKSAAK